MSWVMKRHTIIQSCLPFDTNRGFPSTATLPFHAHGVICDFGFDKYPNMVVPAWSKPTWDWSVVHYWAKKCRRHPKVAVKDKIEPPTRKCGLCGTWNWLVVELAMCVNCASIKIFPHLPSVPFREQFLFVQLYGFYSRQPKIWKAVPPINTISERLKASLLEPLAPHWNAIYCWDDGGKTLLTKVFPSFLFSAHRLTAVVDYYQKENASASIGFHPETRGKTILLSPLDTFTEPIRVLCAVGLSTAPAVNFHSVIWEDQITAICSITNKTVAFKTFSEMALTVRAILAATYPNREAELPPVVQYECFHCGKFFLAVSGPTYYHMGKCPHCHKDNAEQVLNKSLMAGPTDSRGFVDQNKTLIKTGWSMKPGSLQLAQWLLEILNSQDQIQSTPVFTGFRLCQRDNSKASSFTSGLLNGLHRTPPYSLINDSGSVSFQDLEHSLIKAGNSLTVKILHRFRQLLFTRFRVPQEVLWSHVLRSLNMLIDQKVYPVFWDLDSPIDQTQVTHPKFGNPYYVLGVINGWAIQQSRSEITLRPIFREQGDWENDTFPFAVQHSHPVLAYCPENPCTGISGSKDFSSIISKDSTYNRAFPTLDLVREGQIYIGRGAGLRYKRNKGDSSRGDCSSCSSTNIGLLNPPITKSPKPVCGVCADKLDPKWVLHIPTIRELEQGPNGPGFPIDQALVTNYYLLKMKWLSFVTDFNQAKQSPWSTIINDSSTKVLAKLDLSAIAPYRFTLWSGSKSPKNPSGPFSLSRLMPSTTLTLLIGLQGIALTAAYALNQTELMPFTKRQNFSHFEAITDDDAKVIYNYVQNNYYGSTASLNNEEGWFSSCLKGLQFIGDLVSSSRPTDLQVMILIIVPTIYLVSRIIWSLSTQLGTYLAARISYDPSAHDFRENPNPNGNFSFGHDPAPVKDWKPASSLLIASLGTTGDQLPLMWFGRLAAYHGIKTHLWQIKSANVKEVENLMKGDFKAFTPGYADLITTHWRQYQYVFQPHVQPSGAGSSYNLSPDSNWINPITYSKTRRTPLIWFVEQLALTFSGDLRIGAIKGSALPRSANGFTLLEQDPMVLSRYRLPRKPRAMVYGSAHLDWFPKELRDDPSIDKIHVPYDPSIFSEYEEIYCHGGAGTIQTIIAYGAKPLIPGSPEDYIQLMDRSYKVMPQPTDFKQPSALPFIGMLWHAGFTLENISTLSLTRAVIMYYWSQKRKWLQTAFHQGLRLALFASILYSNYQFAFLLLFSIPLLVPYFTSEQGRTKVKFAIGAVWHYPIIFISRSWLNLLLGIFIAFEGFHKVFMEINNAFLNPRTSLIIKHSHGFPFPLGHFQFRDNKSGKIFEPRFLKDEGFLRPFKLLNRSIANPAYSDLPDHYIGRVIIIGLLMTFVTSGAFIIAGCLLEPISALIALSLLVTNLLIFFHPFLWRKEFDLVNKKVAPIEIPMPFIPEVLVALIEAEEAAPYTSWFNCQTIGIQIAAKNSIIAPIFLIGVYLASLFILIPGEWLVRSGRALKITIKGRSLEEWMAFAAEGPEPEPVSDNNSPNLSLISKTESTTFRDQFDVHTDPFRKTGFREDDPLWRNDNNQDSAALIRSIQLSIQSRTKGRITDDEAWAEFCKLFLILISDSDEQVATDEKDEGGNTITRPKFYGYTEAEASDIILLAYAEWLMDQPILSEQPTYVPRRDSSQPRLLPKDHIDQPTDKKSASKRILELLFKVTAPFRQIQYIEKFVKWVELRNVEIFCYARDFYNGIKYIGEFIYLTAQHLIGFIDDILAIFLYSLAGPRTAKRLKNVWGLEKPREPRISIRRQLEEEAVFCRSKQKSDPITGHLEFLQDLANRARAQGITEENVSKIFEAQERTVRFRQPVMTHETAKDLEFEEGEFYNDPTFETRNLNYRHRYGTAPAADMVFTTNRHNEYATGGTDRYMPGYKGITSFQREVAHAIADSLVAERGEFFEKAEISTPREIQQYQLNFMKNKEHFSPGIPFNSLKTREAMKNAGFYDLTRQYAEEVLLKTGQHPGMRHHAFGKAQVVKSHPVLYGDKNVRMVVAEDQLSYMIGQVFRLEVTKRNDPARTGAGMGMRLNQNMKYLYDQLLEAKQEGGSFFIADANQYDSKTGPWVYEALCRIGWHGYKHLPNGDAIASYTRAHYDHLQESVIFTLTERKDNNLVIAIPKNNGEDILMQSKLLSSHQDKFIRLEDALALPVDELAQSKKIVIVNHGDEMFTFNQYKRPVPRANDQGEQMKLRLFTSLTTDETYWPIGDFRDRKDRPSIALITGSQSFNEEMESQFANCLAAHRHQDKLSSHADRLVLAATPEEVPAPYARYYLHVKSGQFPSWFKYNSYTMPSTRGLDDHEFKFQSFSDMVEHIKTLNDQFRPGPSTYPVMHVDKVDEGINRMVKLHENQHLLYNMHLKNRGGGTGEATTTFTNTIGFQMAIRAAWWDFHNYAVPLSQFRKENVLFNTGDDSGWTIKISRRELMAYDKTHQQGLQRLKDSCLKYDLRLDIELVDRIEDVEYLGTLVHRPTARDKSDILSLIQATAKVNSAARLTTMAPILSKIPAPTSVPNYVVVKDTAEALVRRMELRYYQASSGSISPNMILPANRELSRADKARGFLPQIAISDPLGSKIVRSYRHIETLKQEISKHESSSDHTNPSWILKARQLEKQKAIEITNFDTQYRLYQQYFSPIMEKKYLAAALQRNVGHLQLTAFHHGLYQTFALEAVEDITNWARLYNITKFVNVSLKTDDFGLKYIDLKFNHEKECTGPRQRQALRFLRTLHPPSYLRVLQIWMRPDDTDMTEEHRVTMDKLFKKASRIYNPRTQRYDFNAIHEVAAVAVDRVIDFTQLFPRSLYKMMAGPQIIYPDYTWTSNQMLVEKFIFRSIEASIPDGDTKMASEITTIAEIGSSAAASPYSSCTNGEAFIQECIENPAYLEEVRKYPLYVYKNMVALATIVYASLYWLELIILKVPWFGLVYKIFMVFMLQIPRLYAMANLLFWHSTGRSSATISAMFPRDIYIHMKRLTISMVEILPIELGYVLPLAPLIDLFPSIFEHISVYIKVHNERAVSVGSNAKFDNPWKNGSTTGYGFIPSDIFTNVLTNNKYITISSATGTGKSTLFPYALLQARRTTFDGLWSKITGEKYSPLETPYDFRAIWICVPRILLRETWDSPENTDGSPYKVQKLTNRTTIDPTASIYIGTYGHLLNRMKQGQIQANDIILMDEFHERDGAMMSMIELDNFTRRIFFLSATPKTLKYLIQKNIQPYFFKTPIPRRFPITKVIRSSTPIMNYLWAIDEWGPLKAAIYVPTYPEVDALRACLHDLKKTTLEISGRTQHLKQDLGSVDVLVCTSVVITGANLPDIDIFISCGEILRNTQGQLERVAMNQADALQTEGRAGRYRPGYYVCPPHEGTGIEAEIYAAPNYYQFEAPCLEHNLQKMTLITNEFLAQNPHIVTHGNYKGLAIDTTVVPERYQKNVLLCHILLSTGIKPLELKPLYMKWFTRGNLGEEMEYIQRQITSLGKMYNQAFQVVYQYTMDQNATIYAFEELTGKEHSVKASIYQKMGKTTFYKSRPLRPIKGRWQEPTEAKINLSLPLTANSSEVEVIDLLYRNMVEENQAIVNHYEEQLKRLLSSSAMDSSAKADFENRHKRGLAKVRKDCHQEDIRSLQKKKPALDLLDVQTGPEANVAIHEVTDKTTGGKAHFVLDSNVTCELCQLPTAHIHKAEDISLLPMWWSSDYPTPTQWCHFHQQNPEWRSATKDPVKVPDHLKEPFPGGPTDGCYGNYLTLPPSVRLTLECGHLLNSAGNVESVWTIKQALGSDVETLPNWHYTNRWNANRVKWAWIHRADPIKTR